MKLHVSSIQTNLDAFELYRRIADGEDSISLDSSKTDLPYGRYSILGVNSFLTMKYEQHLIYEKIGSGPFVPCDTQPNVFDYLKEKMAQYHVDNPSTLPFVGGAIGYLSYDLGCQEEEVTMTAKELVAVPDAYFVFYDNAIVVDHSMQEVFVTGLGIREAAQTSVDSILAKIQSSPKEASCPTPSKTGETPFFQSPFSADDYQKTIERVRHYIREGHSYITNVTHTFQSAFQGDPLLTYESLRERNPAPFSAFLPLHGFSVLCSSPERFLQVRNGQVQTRPIKGTIPRGRTPEEDAHNQKRLETSEKDRSELLMIVDLERNDLSKVCKPGSVKVTELFKLEAFATVFHLVSTVVGTLDDSYTAVDCLRAGFPGGSITGAPKKRAMEIIDELEATRRNLYTGCIGYFGFDGAADFNIIIRSILVKDQRAYIGVGGGITWESEPQTEYEETIAKAMALFQSLGADYSI